MFFTEIEQRDENGNWVFSHAVRVTCSTKTWDRIVDDDDLDMFIRNHIYMGF